MGDMEGEKGERPSSGLLAVDRALKTLGDDVLMGEMLPSAAKSSA